VSLVGDQTGEQVDGRHSFGLGLAQPGFQHGGDTAEAQLAQGAFELDEVHGFFSVRFSMRSR
jgi:hypothetical protein